MVTLVSGRWTIGIPFGLNLARGREPLIHEWYISGSVDRSEDEGKFTPVRRGDASSVTYVVNLLLPHSHGSIGRLDVEFTKIRLFGTQCPPSTSPAPYNLFSGITCIPR